MNQRNTICCLLFILSVALTNGPECRAQAAFKTAIRGTVTDASTGNPIPYVSVLLEGTTIGTLTGSNGKYMIESYEKIKSGIIQFSFIGYQTVKMNYRAGVEQTINVSLKLSDISLSEVTVRPKRKEYRNRDNPAVELIRNVIEHKKFNREESYSYLQYRKYEKIEFGVSNIGIGFENARIFDKFRFIFNNIDTTRRIGKRILPVYIREVVSDFYYRRKPEATKEIIRAEKSVDLSRYVDNNGIAANLNYLYQNINIYDNDILFLTNRFLSPIANDAPLFYRYYIIDTIPVVDIRCIKLFFEPRNKADFLFHGDLYITLDSTYAVRKIDIGINKKINIDWIQDLTVTQDFEKFGEKSWLLSKEEIAIDAGIVKNSIGLYGQRTVTYSDYRINDPINDSVFTEPILSEKIDTASSRPGYWAANRKVPLSRNESGIYTVVDSVQKVQAFRNKMTIVMLLSTGLLDLGKYYIGPVTNFYSFNSIEGTRLRFGGLTSPYFSRKVTFDGYVAYGFRDRIFKYNAGIIYSLTPRTIYEFPVRSLSVSYLKDTRVPGQELIYTEGDNFFLSFKRGISDKLLLNSTFRIEYLHEFATHFSYLLGYRFTWQVPEGNLRFNKTNYLSQTGQVPGINISEPYIHLRYAPNETFYQGKLFRYPFPSRYPVIQFKAGAGLKPAGSDFNYLRIQANIGRRFYLSIVGYTDVLIESGKIFGSVPFPLLFIMPANQTYSYENYSYNLMNFLEFVSDQYVSLNIDHSFNGFFLNKVPLIKKLKLREVLTLKVLYGGITSGNNPDHRPGLFKFPVDSQGLPLTYSLGSTPYIEASVGLSNIMRIFRVDLIRRFTYLQHPDVSEVGLRIRFRFDI